ncbi:hypothetical protein [Sedimentibacter sp.]|uniref:hypothetical protein n=1 Tax=Sedimentibacter sp. TaxID=1960295 RepID=UPI00289FF52D|nr:hypothetical protein [Sedimentibacter sp.]
MKKCIYAMCIFLLIAINFTGCKSISTNKPDDVITDSDEKSNEEDDEQSTDAPDKKLIPLEEASPEQLSFININKAVSNRVISFNLADTHITSNTVYFNEYIHYIRNSTKILYCEGYDDKYNTDDIQLNIEKEDYNIFDNFETPLTIVRDLPYAEFNGFNEESEIMKVESFNFGYDMWQVKFNGFIKRNDDGKTFNIVIDPAYMYGIPVYHDKEALCKYNINGLNIKADTLDFNCEIDIDMTGENTKENADSFNDIGSEYIYAAIETYRLTVNYTMSSKKTEYSNTGILTKCTPITTNTTDALTKSADLNFSAESKDPNMKTVYDVLISNTDTIINEKTVGVVLLDLDFDTFPELLVSRQSGYTDSEGAFQSAVDTDIYRITDNELKYIDTIYNYHRVMGTLSNVIAAKTLEDGSKAWFNMSYKNRENNKTEDTDYLFALKGDTLEFTEIFRTENIEDPDNPGKTITNYYNFGKKIEFEANEQYDEAAGESTTSSSFGRAILFGNLKEKYCEDMRDSTFNLYSDWIVNLNEYESVSQKELSTRMIHHELAYLVDAYYLGEYSPETYDYNYIFLGGYAKPVIYLYPEKETEVSVSIALNGALTCTYPTYKNGWNVLAGPDGTLINKDDGREYSYLYWEGIGESSWDMSKGFVVKGTDTMKFLQEKLEYMGLTPKELNEFIVYWLPHMQNNKYNLITFQTDIYENSAKLNINPEPDSVLRVFMVYKALDEFAEVQEPKLETFKRNGFTVIEWGGTELK